MDLVLKRLENTLPLMKPKSPRRRGKGFYSLNSISAINTTLEKRYFPFLDSKNTDFSNTKEIIETTKDFLAHRLTTETFNTVRKEKSFIQTWLVTNFGMNPKRLEYEFSDFTIPETQVDKTQKSVSLNELQNALNEVKNPKHKLLIRTLYFTGGRVSETLSLKLKDAKIRKEEVVFTTLGKGNRSRELRIPFELFKEIKESFNSKGFLFYNPKSLKGKFSRQFVFELTNSMGISPHQLRHSRATHLVEDGVPINEVSELLGHSTVSTTVKYYIHSRIKTDTLKRKQLW